MKRGCVANVLFLVVLVLAFAGSTYFWFTFFVKGRSLPTPNLIGKTVPEARAICSDLGVRLDVRPERRNSDKVQVDRVVWQNRTPGGASFIKRGTSIRVELSAGPLILRVPELAGQSGGTGMLRLGQQNLKVGGMAYVDMAPSKIRDLLAALGVKDQAPQAQAILAADPPKDTVVQAQTAVSLLVAVPSVQPTFVMPDLIDKPLADVRPSLETRGLVVSTVKYEAYPGIPDGIIIRQYPLRGAPVSSRDPITVVVSRAEDTAITDQPPAPQPAAPVLH